MAANMYIILLPTRFPYYIRAVIEYQLLTACLQLHLGQVSIAKIFCDCCWYCNGPLYVLFFKEIRKLCINVLSVSIGDRPFHIWLLYKCL